jgi:hypothetical protein
VCSSDLAGLAAAAGIGALTLGLKASLSAAAEAEKLELRLGAVLRATGNAAGFTQKQLQNFASELQGSLKINDEKITESIAVLATFRSVSGDTFKQGIKLAADMAAVFGGDLVSATRQIGLALQDPIAGMNALRRAGVTFTETQKDLIESLQKSGDLLGAQKVIAAELENQIGGARKAEAGGLTGATEGLANAWDDLLERIGRTEGVMAPAMAVINTVASAFRGISTLFASEAGQTIVELNKKIIEAQDKIASVQKGGIASYLEGRPSAQIENNKKIIADAEKQIELLIAKSRAESDAEGAAQSRAKASAAATQAAIAQEQIALNLKEEAAKADKEASEQAIKAAKDLAKEREDAYEMTLRNSNVAYEAARAENDLDDERQVKLDDYIAGLETVNRQTGLSVVAREQELAVLAAQEISVAKISEKEEERIRNAVKLRVENEEAAAAAKKLLAEISATAERMADDVSQFLVDGFVNASEGGKSTFDDMWDAAMAGGKRFLANIAAEILKQKFILPITTSIVGAVPGLFGIQGGQTAAGGGGGGAGGALNTAGNAASLLGAATGPSAFLTNSVVNFGLSSGAYGVGTGLSIAAAAPYAAAAAAIVSLLAGSSLFKKSSVGKNAGGRIDELNGQFFGTGFGSDNGGQEQLAEVRNVVDTSISVINEFVKGAGLLDKQVGSGIREAVQIFASGKDPIHTTVESLVKDMFPFVEGLTDAQRATINATAGLEGLTTVLAQIAEEKAFPAAIAAQRLQLEDPRQFAVNELDAWRTVNDSFAQGLTDNATVLADIAAIYTFNLGKINDQFAVAGTVSTLAADIAGQRLQLEDPRQFAVNELDVWRTAQEGFAAGLENNAGVLADIAAIYTFNLGKINDQFAVAVEAVVDLEAASREFGAILAANAAASEAQNAAMKERAGFVTEVSDLLLGAKDPAAFAALQIDREEQVYRDRAIALNAGTQTLLQIEEHFSIKRTALAEQTAAAITPVLAAANDNLDQFNSIITSISNGANDAAQALQKTADSLKEFLSGLDIGPLSALSIGDQYSAAKAQFTDNASAETARSLLEISRKFDPGQGFSADSAYVRDTLSGIISGTPDKIAQVYSAANAQIAGVQAQRAAQNEAQRIAPLVAAATAEFWNVRRTGSDEQQATFAAGLSPDIKEYMPEFGGARIPGFANGGPVPIGSPFWVGECGGGGSAELLQINGPPGTSARVYPHRESLAMAGGGDWTPVISAIEKQGDAARRQSLDETQAMLKMLGEMVRQQGRMIADLQLERSQVRRVA